MINLNKNANIMMTLNITKVLLLTHYIVLTCGNPRCCATLGDTKSTLPDVASSTNKKPSTACSNISWPSISLSHDSLLSDC